MPGKLTLFPSKRVPRFLLVRDEESLTIGRDPECGLLVEDARVSKRHARLAWTGSGWRLEDLGSKNGTSVNGGLPAESALADGDWISLGGLMARFEQLTAAQAASLDSERLARIQSSGEMRRRLISALGKDPRDLLFRFLDLSMKAAGAERGFVLMADSRGRLRPEVAVGFTPEQLRAERFLGSVGALREVLATGQPLIVSADIVDFPGRRSGVYTDGIRSLACLPLRNARKLLGVVYLDSQQFGHRLAITDLEILESLADGATTALAKANRHRRIERSPNDDLLSQLGQRLDDLLPID